MRGKQNWIFSLPLLINAYFSIRLLSFIVFPLFLSLAFKILHSLRKYYILVQKNLSILVYMIKRKLRGGLKVWILYSRGKKTVLLTFALLHEILLSPLENKIYIFALSCNMLYIFTGCFGYSTADRKVATCTKFSFHKLLKALSIWLLCQLTNFTL